MQQSSEHSSLNPFCHGNLSEVLLLYRIRQPNLSVARNETSFLNLTLSNAANSSTSSGPPCSKVQKRKEKKTYVRCVSA